MEEEQNGQLPLGYRWWDSWNIIDHLTHIASYYRQTLDHLPAIEVIHISIGGLEIFVSIIHCSHLTGNTLAIITNWLAYCLVGEDVWCAQVPLICFHIVEWHNAVRILHQFGLQQPIPGGSNVDDALHDYTLQGKQDKNWPLFHA